jgi:hypothetical protein
LLLSLAPPALILAAPFSLRIFPLLGLSAP